MPTLALRFERDELQETFQYGCMVEMWDRVVGRCASGSKRRKYKEAFTDKERKFISNWHTRFAKWHLVSGPPEQVYFKDLRSVDLLRRATYFFATV